MVLTKLQLEISSSLGFSVVTFLAPSKSNYMQGRSYIVDLAIEICTETQAYWVVYQVQVPGLQLSSMSIYQLAVIRGNGKTNNIYYIACMGVVAQWYVHWLG